ncbi:MAG: hypothetical protein QGD94_11890, partial [Planctomycetia bacterium]|nr:hypothetical protein [Planctomycetia bacterium]
RAGAAKSDIKVASENKVLGVYLARGGRRGKTVIVIELGEHKFPTERKTYGCVMVNGKLLKIQEYNREDSYVRGEVVLGREDKELTIYSGVLVHPARINTRKHAPLWQAFLDSRGRPFVAQRSALPKWWTNNPIRQRKDEEAGKTPLPTIVPPRIQVKRHTYISDEERPAALKEAMNGDFRSVWGLAISGYTPEAHETLTKVACDKSFSKTTRNYAAIGLGNFFPALDEKQRASLRLQLKRVVADERGKTPDEILRLMLGLGGVSFIYEILGKSLTNHAMEIEVLRVLPQEGASERLWQMQRRGRGGAKPEAYSRAADIGRALVDRKDKRGIDMLLSLLPAENAPGPQYRNNVFNFLALRLENNFGYAAGDYRPELEEAIPKMIRWWEDNASGFSFDPQPEDEEDEATEKKPAKKPVKKTKSKARRK